MAIVNKEIKIASELSDVLVLVEELIVDVKAGKDIGAIVSENLPLLIAAIGGADQIPVELKADMKVALETVGLHVGSLAAALLAPAPSGAV